MRIDLVETQEELHIFEHQFVPFDGVFGCNIFTLSRARIPGNNVRFPFRTKECEASEICKKCYLKQDWCQVSHEIALFLLLKSVIAK